ncbi:MAG TPA: recombinase RecT [Chlamydiales bacterium]|nr:recombinase RecT [Chlamydiales bacterium]
MISRLSHLRFPPLSISERGAHLLPLLPQNFFSMKLCSTKLEDFSSKEEKKKEIYSISTDVDKGECVLQLNAYVPRMVWEKVNAIFTENDFSWNKEKHTWTSSSTIAAEKTLEKAKEYLDATQQNFEELHNIDKKQKALKWIEAEEAFLSSLNSEAIVQFKELSEIPFSQAVSTQSENEKFLSLFTQIQAQAEKLLPKHIDSKRFFFLIKQALEKVDGVFELDPESVRKAVFIASALGLEPGDITQHCYFVPYEKELKFVIGYRGLIELSIRAGETLFYEAGCVYKQDRFEVKEPPHQELFHSPHLRIDERGEITHFYALRAQKNGQYDICVLSIDDLKKTKAIAQGLNNPKSVWHNWVEVMGLKSVVKCLAKMTELSVQENTQPDKTTK